MTSLKLKSLVLAVAMAAAGAAQATPISTDNITGGLSTGDGLSGDLFLSILDPIAGQSLILNTGLTTGQFINSNGSLINVFSTTNSVMQSFFSGHSADLSSMVWNIGAIVNGDYTVGHAGVLNSNGTGPVVAPDGTALQSAMNRAQTYTSQYDAILAGGVNAATAVAASSIGYSGGNWGNSWGGFFGYPNTMTGFSGGETMSYLSFNQSDALGTADVTGFTNGKFVIDTSLGKLSYVGTVSAVPVPAAVWLFGSGLLGLVGIGRRKKA